MISPLKNQQFSVVLYSQISLHIRPSSFLFYVMNECGAICGSFGNELLPINQEMNKEFAGKNIIHIWSLSFYFQVELEHLSFELESLRIESRFLKVFPHLSTVGKMPFFCSFINPQCLGKKQQSVLAPIQGAPSAATWNTVNSQIEAAAYIFFSRFLVRLVYESGF